MSFRPNTGGGSGDMLKSTYDANNDGIVDVAASANAVTWTNVSGKPSTFTPEAHTHPQSDITNLVSDLAGKANTSHTHVISDVTGLQTALDSKAEYVFVGSLASNQATGANTTPVVLTDLVFSYEANSKYLIRAIGRVQPTAATTGCGFQFDVSSAVTSIDVSFYHQLANTGTLSGGHSIADNASVGVSSGMPGTSTYPVVLNGLIVTGANTGTAQLMFRSETTAVTTCVAGFTLIVEKIA